MSCLFQTCFKTREILLFGFTKNSFVTEMLFNLFQLYLKVRWNFLSAFLFYFFCTCLSLFFPVISTPRSFFSVYKRKRTFYEGVTTRRGWNGGGGERDYRTDKINKICFQFTIDYN
jgi:hypothetical protein